MVRQVCGPRQVPVNPAWEHMGPRMDFREIGMRIRVSVLALVLLSTAVAAADGPRLLFDRSQIGALRQRIEQPELAPVWKKILTDAEAYCDPASPRYADPQDPCPLSREAGREGQQRHDALLVHTVGRSLTGRMEAIGFAYQLTGRKELGEHGAAVLLATVDRYPITNATISQGFAGGRGDIMRGLAIGYDLLAECLDDERERLAAGCSAYLEHAIEEFNNPRLWWHEVHNYNGVNGGAAGCLALALSDAFPERVEAWTAECVKTVERWLTAGFDQEGAGLEGVSYSDYGLSNTVMFADALRRNGKGDLFGHPTFARLAEFYALSLLPGERVYDARNDSSYAGLSGILLKLADARASGLYRWLWENSGSQQGMLRILWENDVRAVDPVAAKVPLARHFTGRGLCVWRTGWTASDVMFSIEAGPYFPVTHNQADKGHFTLYGLGRRWAVDPGYANEHESAGRGQTLGHSCVLVDGVGQALSGAGWGTNGKIVQYSNSDRCGYALVDATEAYNRNSAGKPGAGVEHARRHAFFVYPHREAPAYALLIDDICKDDQPHEYTWQMMFADGMAATTAGDRIVLEPQQASGEAYADSPPGLAASSKRTGVCRLKLAVSEAGSYVLWARVRVPGEESGKADSFLVAVDGGKMVDWHLPAAVDWTWAPLTSGVERAPVSWQLSAGQHEIAVRMREPGTQIDCLLLARDARVVPSLASVRGDSLFVEAESGEFTEPMRRVDARGSEPRLVLRLDADAEPRISTDMFRPNDWRPPAAFPRLRATARTVNPRFIAVLLPLPPKVREPEVRFERRAGQRVTTVAWPTHTDTFIWSESDGAAVLLEPE